MIASVTISLTTYATWQALLVVLSIVSTSLNIWKSTRGTKQNDATTLAMKDELKEDLRELKKEIHQTRQDVEETTIRLEAHIDRTSVAEVEQLKPKRRKKVADE